MFLNLVVAGALSGAVLSVVFSKAAPVIKANKEKELREAIFILLPEARDFKVMEKTVGAEKLVVYKGIDATGNPVGVAFKADGGGFQGNVGVMVGLDKEYLKVKGREGLGQPGT